MERVKVGKINIGTEMIREEGGRTRAVSTIESTLTKKE